MVRIDTTESNQRWRYECPECASKNWRANNGNFECRACGCFPSGLIDSRTKEFYSRSEIEFVGPESSWKAPYAARPEE